MSSTGGTPSRDSARRIRRVAVALWIPGAIVIAILGITIAFQVFGEGRYAFGAGARDYPWELDQPVEATRSGDVWSGNGGGVITLPDDLGAQAPLLVTLESDDDISVYLSRAGDDVSETRPLIVDYLYPDYQSSTVVLAEPGSRVWVRAGDAWSVTVAPLDAVELQNHQDARGDSFLVYRGDALSAHVQQVGEGVFQLTVYSDQGADSPVIDSGAIDERFSWDPSAYVVFRIHSDAERAAWSLQVDEPAPSVDPGPTPSPAASVAPVDAGDSASGDGQNGQD